MGYRGRKASHRKWGILLGDPEKPGEPSDTRVYRESGRYPPDGQNEYGISVTSAFTRQGWKKMIFFVTPGQDDPVLVPASGALLSEFVIQE